MRDLGTISKAQYDNVFVPAAKKFQSNLWQGRYRTGMATGTREEVKEQLEKSNVAPIPKYAISKQFIGLDANLSTETSGKDAALDAKANQNINDQLVNGARPNSAVSTEIEKTDPKQAAAFHDASDMVQDTHDARQQLQFMNFAQSRQLLANEKFDRNDKNLFYKQQVKQATVAYNENRIAQALKNPAEFTKNAPSVLAAERAAELSPGFNQLKPDEQAQMIKLAGSSAQIAQQRAMGFTQSQLGILSSSDQQQLASSLSDLSSPEAVVKAQNTINSIVNSYGANSNIAFADMHKLHINPDMLDIANLDKIKESAVQLPTIYKAISTPYNVLKNGIIGDSQTESDYTDAAKTALQPMIDTLAQNDVNTLTRASQMKNLVVKAAMADRLSNNSGNADALVKKMAKAIYLNRYSGISGDVRVPEKVSFDQAGRAMQGLSAQIQSGKVQFNDLGRLPGNKAQDSDIRKNDLITMKNGHWRTYNDDRGVYWVDANGQPVTLKGTNKNYELLWPNLEKPASKENVLFQNAINESPSTFQRIFKEGLL